MIDIETEAEVDKEIEAEVNRKIGTVTLLEVLKDSNSIRNDNSSNIKNNNHIIKLINNHRTHPLTIKKLTNNKNQNNLKSLKKSQFNKQK